MTAVTRPVATAVTEDVLRGALEVEQTPTGVRLHRLPTWARTQARDDQLTMAESQPSGVRLAFSTSATSIELRARAKRFGYRGAPARPPGVFDLVVDGALTDQARLATATTVTVDLATGAMETNVAEPDSIVFDNLPVGVKQVEIWLPHTESVELVALRTNADVRASRQRRPVWLHHGSSISHGSNANHPTGTWPAIAASLGDVDLVNLGLSGSALIDPFTARTIRDTLADLISLKLGINVVNADLMRLRAFGPAVHGFLDTIRDGHPDTPLLVVSPIHCAIHEHTPGPGAFDEDALAAGELRFRATGDPADAASGKLTLHVIREELARIVEERAADDPNISYLDGLELYGPADAEEQPLPDALHPGPTTHHRMGERFAIRAFAAGAPLAPSLPHE